MALRQSGQTSNTVNSSLHSMVAGALFLGAAAINSAATAQPPVEVYGELPFTRSMSVSPDGNLVGYLSRDDGEAAALIYDIDAKETIGGLRTTEIKTQSISFASSGYAILRASDTTRISGFRGKLEYTAAFSYDFRENKVKQLLRNNDDLFPAQSGLGRIIGLDNGGEHVYMPAFIGTALSNPSYGVMKVNLKSGRGRVIRRGRAQTRDWIVDGNGKTLAIESYDNRKNQYTLDALRGKKLAKIFEAESEIPPLSLVGIRADNRALVVSNRAKGSDTQELSEIDIITGKFSTAFRRDDADIDYILRDGNQRVIGVQYSGLFPSYEFYDPGMTEIMTGLTDYFIGSSVSLESFSNDLNILMVHVTGGNHAPAFYRFDRANKQLVRMADEYKGITDDNVAETFTVEYKTRDGERINGVVTRPRGSSADTALPTIILPHGGPESYDSVRFDWMSQYFASRGYLVLQPNFRGSDGFGARYKLSGRGEWGRGIMQHDVTDGLKAMIKVGWTDPDRVCIVGASYGGYSALAGGAFTPDLYKCVAAMAPVTDLPRMLVDERRDNGNDSWVLTYWKRLIGDPRKERDKLKNISPSEHADAFQAPVLLIHGFDDTVVPIRQSNIMESALKKAGKEVELVRQKGGDHWLSTSDIRLETLQLLGAFVDQHIGPSAE